MKSTIIRNHFRSPWISLALLLLLTVGLASQAAAFTLEVVTRDAAGALVPMSGSGFRWLLEEDNTNQPPGFPTAG
ncbi:MAG TPA: hypothetical protein DEB35_01020, partial [Desulfuromonas sp.]|nr:hypothetical protein [Desulfuromonas sp.]